MKVRTITQLEITPEHLIQAIADEIEKRLRTNPTSEKPSDLAQLDKIPTLWLYENRIISKTSLYKKVKSGEIIIHKLGGRSYVDRKEFAEAFHKVNITQ